MKIILFLSLLSQSILASELVDWFGDQETKVPDFTRPLSREEAVKAKTEIWSAYEKHARKEGWEKEFPLKDGGMEAWAKERQIQPLVADLGAKKMPYIIIKKGEKPKDGWPLFFALHGGGGNAKAEGPHTWQVNTREWYAQMQLTTKVYEPAGLYVIPRMADDREGRWYYGYNQVFIDRMIQQGILFGEVNPNRVYLMGISEGGYTAFRLGSLMADRWAGSCAMAAAEPLKNAPPENLRHLAFRCGIGEKDTMFDRIGLARTYFKKIEEIKKKAGGDYENFFDEQAGKGHGIDYKPGPTWIAKFERNPIPKRIDWTVIRQHDRSRDQMYWLALTEEPRKLPLRLTAEIRGQVASITSDGPAKLKVLLDDRLLDLDQDVTILVNGELKFQGRVTRNLAGLLKSTAGRGDPELVFSAEVILPNPS